jgi:hypothetical protein
MAERPTGGLDAVERGPLPSDASDQTASVSVDGGSDHPSVAALRARFGDAIQGDRVSAGDETVVWIDPARCLEIMTWLKDDPGQRYDMMSDVTGVDYGGDPTFTRLPNYNAAHA